MTPWELRGYLTYPRSDGKPRAGTSEEISWSRGWIKAQRETQATDNEWAYGRETYFANYDVPIRDKKEFDF